MERAKGLPSADTADLETLARPVLNVLGRFLCGGCENRCTIDRFEVAGRRFPFGGRCTRFEGAWTGADRPAEGVNLIEQRNRILLPAPAPRPDCPSSRCRIDIPRALTTHSLYPLYSTFFWRLGMETVLSGVDASGAMKTNSGFCYPVQIAHGAVLDLIKGGVDWVFLPQVSRMPNPRGGRDSYLCPIAQASPYVIAKAFPSAKILSPVLDFALGYEASTDLVDLAESQLGFPREAAQQAYRQAVIAQHEAEESLLALGRQALAEALADGKPTILLVGRSYNAFPPEASQSVARKLASMGVRVIPGDCLPQERGGCRCPPTFVRAPFG